MKSWSSTLIKKLIERDGLVCHYCLNPIHQNPDPQLLRTHLSVDHLNPQVKGGGNEIDNLVLACHSCNSRKGKKHYQEIKMQVDTDRCILFLMGGGVE